MSKTRHININETPSGKRIYIALSSTKHDVAISVSHYVSKTFKYTNTSVFLHHKCISHVAGGWNEETDENITPTHECDLHETHICQLEDVYNSSVDKFIEQIEKEDFEDVFKWMNKVIKHKNLYNYI